MARNRRNNGPSRQWVPVCKAMAVCMLFGLSASGYVIQKNKLHALGREIRQREAELERLQLENRFKANQLSSLLMPQRLVEQVRERGLDLVPPQQNQIVWLTDEWPPSRSGQPELLISRVGR